MTLDEVFSNISGLDTFYKITYQVRGRGPVTRVDKVEYSDYYGLKGELDNRSMPNSKHFDVTLSGTHISNILKLEELPKEYAVDYHGKLLYPGDKVVLISYNNICDGVIQKFTHSSVMIKECHSGYMRQVNRLIANRKIYKL